MEEKILEDYAREYVQGVVKYNPDYKEIAKDLLHTAFIAGALHQKESEPNDFGKALEWLKMGAKVARKGWNGRGMFLWLKPAAKVKAEWCKDPMLKSLAEKNGGEIDALGTICMYTAQGQILSGWLASQTDMLSEDWEIVEDPA